MEFLWASFTEELELDVESHNALLIQPLEGRKADKNRSWCIKKFLEKQFCHYMLKILYILYMNY
jgi:hypothetical protein